MATPLYDALVVKVRDWSNKKEAATIPDAVIEDCLKYSADDACRLLRVPQLEASVQYTITAANDSDDDDEVSIIDIPSDLTEFISLRTIDDDSTVFDQVNDIRTFFNSGAEKYSRYNWCWMGNYIYLRPRLVVGAVIEVRYYRHLPALDALYSVLAINYDVNYASASQPYLTEDAGGTTLWFALNGGTRVAAFDTEAEVDAYIVLNPTYTKTSQAYVGKEAPNWLRDGNERMVMFGALRYMGAYLFDPDMEARYEKRFMEEVERLNREEKFRRARGGNIQMYFNTGGAL